MLILYEFNNEVFTFRVFYQESKLLTENKMKQLGVGAFRVSGGQHVQKLEEVNGENGGVNETAHELFVSPRQILLTLSFVHCLFSVMFLEYNL